MSSTWKVGVIGLGIMGRRMLEHMGRHEAFEVVAAWDPSPEARAQAARIGPVASMVETPEAVIAAADVVYLACPPAPRKAYALEAAAQGKAVFLEKPLGVDVAESRDLAERLAAAGVPAAVNFTQAAGAALAAVLADDARGEDRGVDIVVTYPHWPRAWQIEADWLRFAAEGGYVREVISHFLFFSARVLGPLELVWARPAYPADPSLCETHVAARLENGAGVPVSVLGSVGGVQPDRQEVTVTGARRSWRISDFYRLAVSDGGPFEPAAPEPEDPRAESLRAQLDDLDKMMRGERHRLATVPEALAVQELVERILAR
ncbi:Gfo/Idh/MocA family oxidoreductase [uncultured Albimonas sp.]|uniref:Gfo/Idh/MocA family protein n=1 Tax=uncultured Albimonas sp. TaxID=1331701 RepID=UPI0030EB771B|tara:strand:+ start:1600 stop:2553 length:954 start_codon:yes stop_codon:yes gene_type:complete